MNLEAALQGCFTLPSQGKFNTRAMGSLRLTCQVEKAEFADIVRPSGDIDLSTTSILGHALATAFSQGRHVIVDLSEVTYLDSTGLRELLAHHRIFRENDRLMVLANPKQPAQITIDRLNLYQVIPVFSSIETAQDSLKGASRLSRSPFPQL